MQDPEQIIQQIDLWCQWDDTFGEDAEGLRAFFQSRPALLHDIFTHFLAVDAKQSKPAGNWWRKWKELQANLPDEITRSLLLGLARRDEWYRCLSTNPFPWQPDLHGFEQKTASDEDGYFTFELFFDAGYQLRFARALDPRQKYGSEHVCGPYFRYLNQRATAYQEYTSDRIVYAWNEQIRLVILSVPAASPDTLPHPHAFWEGEPPSQLVQRIPAHYNPMARCCYISIKSHEQWYNSLPKEETDRTRAISQAACWALSAYHDQEVQATLRTIVSTYARQKPGAPPAAPVPSISMVLPESLLADNFDEKLLNCSQDELMTRCSEQQIFELQVYSTFTWACRQQHFLGYILNQSKNNTYQRAASAVWALSQIADDAAIAGLHHILGRTLDKRFQKLLRTTLDTLAAQRGLSSEDLADRLVPTHDLDAAGQRVWHLGDYRVCLSLTTAGKVQRIITASNGKESKNLPARVRKEYDETWRAVHAEEKALAETFFQQKKRLEDAIVAGRSWPYEHWHSLFVAHPLLSRLAQRLIWQVCTPDGTSLCFTLPGDDGIWYGSQLETLQIEPQSLLRVAHPIEMTPEEHTAWQHVIVARRIVQPFKQAFREIYALTPAEEQTERYSNRFAGHRLVPTMFHGVARGRGWTGDMLHNSEGEGMGWRSFPARSVHASFSLDDGNFGPLAFYSADVHPSGFGPPFERALPLRQVHPLVFSEAMRDLDLFVAVASVGVDPQWQDQVVELQHREYVSREQAQMRAALLQTLLPILGLSDRVSIEEGTVLVSGKRAVYRLHLNSGTIYLHPTGQYLCIVPRAPQNLYLPFEEEDTRTTEILSKILLLVDDEQITDPAILRQIPSRREMP